jgi:hypothetical protein
LKILDFYRQRTELFSPKNIKRSNVNLQPRRELGTKEDFSLSPLPPIILQ